MMDDFYTLDLFKKIQSKLEQIKCLCEINTVSGEIIEHLDELGDLLSEKYGIDQIELSAQISIYPLRQSSLSKTIDTALAVLETSGLKITPGSMSTMIVGREAQLWAGLKNAFSAAASQGEVVMITTISNACPKPNRDHSLADNL